jgi:two-component system, NarL family, nitrate/nitrite response regulator NarL
MTPQPTRVLVAVEHRVFRQALCQALNFDPTVEVAGEAGQRTEAIEVAAKTAADVLLLDDSLAGEPGLGLVKQLTEQGAAVRMILLTDSTNREQVVQAIRLGARGIVDKDVSIDLLVRSIRHVGSGGCWIGHEWIEDLVGVLNDRKPAPSKQRPSETLTTREVQIIWAVLQGGTNKQVSQELGLSEQTVKNHLSNIFDKLGVGNRLELALYAVNHDIVPSTTDRFARQSA